MKPEEIEDAYLRSLDGKLDEAQKRALEDLMKMHTEIAKELGGYTVLREQLLRKEEATFGPWFPQKVIHRIQNLRVEIDQQIIFFFKKYQLAALGILVALFAVNVIFADSLDIPSVLGIDETVSPAQADDELLSFDFYENLTNN